MNELYFSFSIIYFLHLNDKFQHHNTALIAINIQYLHRSWVSSSPLLKMEAESVLPKWGSEPCIMGIDEAGRGPVLGTSCLCIYTSTHSFCILLFVKRLSCLNCFQGQWCMGACIVHFLMRTPWPHLILQVSFSWSQFELIKCVFICL